MIKTFLVALMLTLAVGGGYYVVKYRPDLLARLNIPQINKIIEKKQGEQIADAESPEGDVLGTGDQQSNEPQNVAQRVLQPVINTVGKVLGQTTTAVTTAAQTEQGVNVKSVFESAKSQASNIPEEVFVQARYEYCKQVVADFEKR